MITFGGAVLHFGNCLDIVPQLGKNSIDVIIADPPYGLTACKWDKRIPFPDMWEMIDHIIKPNGAICLFGSQPFSSELVCSNLKMFRNEWIWNKVSGANFANLKYRPWKTQEQILVFSKKPKFNFFPVRVMRAISSLIRYPIGMGGKVKQGKDNRSKHYGNIKRRDHEFSIDGTKHPIDILTFPVTDRGIERYGSKLKHPTMKPVKLMEYFVKTYSQKGDTVLDFCMGSGSTGVAAIRHDRKFIGIEKEKKFFDIAAERITEENEKGVLF